MRHMMLFSLRSAGFSVLEAVNGQEGLSVFRAKTPDLVVSDVNMPVLDGISMIRRIREFSDVPIIVLSTECSESGRQAGKDAGADGWVCKPFNPQKLVDAVRTLLARADSAS